MTDEEKAKRVQEALQKVDFTDIVGALSQLAGKVLAGIKIETKEYQINLSVPEEVVKVFEKVVEATDIEMEDILSSLASQGLSTSLNGARDTVVQQQAEQVAPPPQEQANPLQEAGFDITKLTSKLGELGALAEQLQGMQKVFENADGNQDQNKKDNK